MNPLSNFFLHFTEAGTEKKIRVRADLIAAYAENSRGSTDLWTTLTDDGGSKVFAIAEAPEEILASLQEAYSQVKEKVVYKDK